MSLKHLTNLCQYGVDSLLRVAYTCATYPCPFADRRTGGQASPCLVFPKGGLVWNDGDAATTETMEIDYGELRYAYPRKSSFYARTAWGDRP
jgi:hypothetical protein